MAEPKQSAARSRPRSPWYSGGLRFACQPGCGACCTRHGDYAHVYLEGDDAARLARHLGLSLGEFRHRWTVLDEGELILRIEGPACPFLDGARCTVYEARPRQCHTFPFWPENLATRGAWTRLRSFCPGIGVGPIVPLVEIRAQAAEHDET
jgi:uncharacterized protein